MSINKIKTIQEIIKISENLKEDGKKISLCHGVFDLMHPGHIIHFQEAKEAGDILIVSITAAQYVQKGPGRPYFNDEIRQNTIAALECVDYVFLSNSITAFDSIEAVKPDLYIKGSEYENKEDDPTRNIGKEIDCVRKFGGDVYYTKGQVFSSTKLLNNNFNMVSKELTNYVKENFEGYSFADIKKMVDDLNDIKVLVIGDVIIDEYVFCGIQGLASKDTAFSAKYIREERYLGGSLAIAKHIASLCKNVTVCGVIGTEADIHSEILNTLGNVLFTDLIFDKDFKTVRKRRYIQQKGIREEYNKVFSINYIDEEENFDRDRFYDKLNSIVGNYDLVVVCDYGHGLLDEKAIEIIQEKSKYLALNCQTNSSNYGRNLITKYKKADTFTLDERELMLAFSKNISELDVKKELLKELKNKLNSEDGYLTIGSNGCIGIQQDRIVHCPAVILTVKDTVGAGDALLAVVSVCSYAKLPIAIATFLGNIAGGLAANIMGNAESIDKKKFLKFASTSMNV